MGKYNLNNPIDFARATNSFGAGVLQTFTARGSSDWLIEEGKYRSGIDPTHEMVFHVFISSKDYQGALSQITDTGGRRKAKFEFPFLDGQLLNDMGRLGESFQIEIMLHGNNYLAAYKELIALLNEPVPGTLTHPVRGEISCAMESVEVIHKESERKSVAIRVHMSEHSLEALNAINGRSPTKTAPSLLSKLTTAFKKIEDGINAVQGALFLVQSVKLQITNGLTEYQNSYSKVAGSMNATFNPGGNIPALLPTQGGGLQDSSGAIVSNSVTNALSPKDPFASIPTSLLSTALQQALAIDHIQADIETVRFQLNESIQALLDAGNGKGALEFYDNIIALRETANDLQAAFEAGKQSSQVHLIDYVTPRVMSIREVAYANGVLPNESDQVALLNPDLESLNYIPKGVTVKVAIS